MTWVSNKIVGFKHTSIIVALVCLACSCIMAQPQLIDIFVVPLLLVFLFLLRIISKIEGRGGF
jgi:hypothetical protein